MAGTWSEITAAGHVCDWFAPEICNTDGYALIYLHDAEGDRLVDRPAFTAEFERQGLPVICPRTGRSWWTDRAYADFDPRLTAERYVVDHVSPDLAERCGARPPGVALLGVGMGGQGALRLSFKHPDRFPIPVAISPAIDYHLLWREGVLTLPLLYADQEAARQDTAILHVHPLNWPRNIWFCCDPAEYRWHQSADRLHMKLGALGIPHDYDLETTVGNRLAYDDSMAPRAMAFIAERLARERLRVK